MTSAEFLERARDLGARESGLAVVAITRPDDSVQGSIVNAGVLEHPITGDTVVGFVARGYAKKLVYLRARSRVTVVFRSGWEWVAIEGDAELAGPHDAHDGFDIEATARLIREIYAAAVGGAPDDWSHLDDAIEEEGHTAVLISPTRIYSNPAEPETP